MTTIAPKKMAPIVATEDIVIELATRPALRLWMGRDKTDTKHGILGLPGFCSRVRSIEQAIREDDPYADYHFAKIEEGIIHLSEDLDEELKDIKAFIAENVPTAMRLPDVASKNPVVVPVRFASRLGFKLVYQLLKVDQVVLSVLLASHIGLLPNTEKFQALSRVEKRLRSVLHLVYNYRHCGVTRDDMAANNQRAQKAKEVMGELEAGYLEGTVRSDNAPGLPSKRMQTLGSELSKSASVKSQDIESENKDLASELDRVLAEQEAELDSLKDEDSTVSA
jgi:integrating conjugative element protein (TIGR03761 family)